MPAVWLLLIAVLLPAGCGLVTLLLPRGVVTARVLLAALGPALAFVLIAGNLSLGTGAGAEATAGAGHHAATTEAAHDAHAVAGVAADTTDIAPTTAATGVLAWVPSMHLDLAFLPDGLGGFFGLLVSGIGVLIVLYARGYFGSTGPTSRDDLYRFYPTLGFFTTAMLGVVLADFTLLTLVFWELTSISSFLLIGWDRYDKQAVKLAIQAFFTTGLGGMFLLGGIALFGGATGVWRWSELASQAHTVDWSSTPVVGAFGLMLVGAFAKSAQWPFHYWLPGAMAAPTPVSAFLHSATMVKAGVFLVGRMLPAFGGAGGFGGAGLGAGGIELWASILIPFGTVTMLYAAIMAVCKHDLKQIFAYTTVSQLGLLMAMYGLGGLTYTHDGHTVAAIDFDITQIANHAFYKAPLFITAGAIGHVASRQLPELFGAFKKHPAICGTMLAAAWALAALPGSISFQAKELFIYAVYHAAGDHPLIWGVMAATVGMAACNVAIFVRLATTLLGIAPFGMQPESNNDGHGTDANDHGHDEHTHEHGLWAAMIWLPAVPLVALQFVGGIATPVWDAMFLPLETNRNYAGFAGHIPALWEVLMHPGVPLAMSGLGVVLGVVLGISPLLRRVYTDPHNAIYPATAAALYGLGALFISVIQGGNLRYYFVAVIGAMVVGFGASVYHDPAMFDVFGPAFAMIFESLPTVFLGIVICVTAFLLPLTHSRVVRVLILGACGFAVVSMYVMYQAPDLALTQLFFEIISVLLFVLVLRLLPQDHASRRVGVPWRIVVASAAGLTVGWLTLVAAMGNPDLRLGEFFIQHSHHGTAVTDGRGGGGFNVVNVILVDFRGFDTLGEITVLSLAALGVWSMLFGRGRKVRRP